MGSLMVQVSTYQMSILLQFNSSSELRLSHLQISTQLSDVCSILRIVVWGSFSPVFCNDTSFVINNLVCNFVGIGESGMSESYQVQASSKFSTVKSLNSGLHTRTMYY